MMISRLLLLMATLALLPPGARAQVYAETADSDQTPHVLEIRNGSVWLDNRRLPPNAVPDGLDLEGLQMSVEYSGPVTPVVEVDGIAYVLQDERLVPFDESNRAGSQVYFLGEASPAPQSAPREPAATLAGGAGREGESDDARLRRAGEAAYMRQLSATDQELYEQIQREAALEAAAEQLAASIRATEDPDERAAGVERLRAVLAEAFDLKQQIREAEIQRAEQQVGELKRMLRERGARRSMIVEHRIRELLGD
jgi:hypothetical protein